MDLEKRRIATVVLAHVLLFAPSSFAASFHFCAYHLLDVNYSGNTKLCHAIPVTTDGPEKPCSGENDCCQLKVFDKKMADYLYKNNTSEEDKYPVLFPPDLIYGITFNSVAIEGNLPPLKNYLHPTVAEDLQVLYETFLI